LLPWQLETEGSEPLVLGAFDTELGQHCRFAPDSELSLRCLPLVPGSLQATTNYADPQCSQRVYSSLEPAARAVLAAQGRAVAVPQAPDSCAESFTVGTLQPLPASASRYFKTDAGCALSGSAPPDQQDAELEFTLDQVIAPERFVRGREVEGALVGGRLRVRDIETEQGFRAQRHLVDERWQKPCSLAEVGASLGCFPATLDAYTSFFDDQECAGQSVWRAPACVDPAFIGRTGDLYALGPEFTGTVWENGKGCHQVSSSSGERFFSQGPPLDDSAVVKASWLAAGSGRLSLLGLQGDDGKRVRLADELFDSSSLRRGTGEFHFPRYHDQVLGDCSPVFTIEGEVRCVPRTALIDPFQLFFVDSECSEPAYFCSLADGCAGADMIAMAYDENGEFRAVSRNQIELIDEQPLFAAQADGCSMQAAPAGMFRKGLALAWDEYPLLEERQPRRSGEL